MPEQPNIALYPDKNTRVEHYVKTPRLPPGFAYTIRHCVAQSEHGPIYKLIYNRCFDHKVTGVLFSQLKILCSNLVRTLGTCQRSLTRVRRRPFASSLHIVYYQVYTSKLEELYKFGT